MKIDQIISAQKRNWSVVRKLGEGDAGEVYWMTSLLDSHPAVLKRPRHGGLFSDIQRQARQIRTEGNVLQGLGRVNFPNTCVHLRVPTLLDQNQGESILGEQTFIVLSPAAGIDLRALWQLLRAGSAYEGNLPGGADYAFFIDQWVTLGEFPEPLLVRILLGVLEMLETIHNPAAKNEQTRQLGIIWNDVKAEHLFWNPLDASLTVIDWGNSQYLKEDGATKDRQFTFVDDFSQFLDEMGRFISEISPELFKRLNWPAPRADAEWVVQEIKRIKDALTASWETLQTELRALRTQEIDLTGNPSPGLAQLDEVANLWPKLALYGELPDLAGLQMMFSRMALQMASIKNLQDFLQVCQRAAALPEPVNQLSGSGKWPLLSIIARIPTANDQERAILSSAVASGVAGDWPGMTWELFRWIGYEPLPEWWGRISHQIRSVALGLSPEALPPYGIISRSLDELLAAIVLQPITQPFGSEAATSTSPINLLKASREEILTKWIDVTPAPPNSGVAYSEFDRIANDLRSLAPDAWERIERGLAQPKAQAEIVLSAWERKEFEAAQKGLRSLLLWDPDRRRLLSADRAIGSARQWLDRVHRGAARNEPFYDFLTTVELEGRVLRNQVGAASWLDTILEALKRLRKGARSVDLTVEFPDLQNELTWLNEYRSREILSLPRSRSLTLERDLSTRLPSRPLSGLVEGRFGPGEDLVLGEPLDNWRPEAQGSSARVFAGMLRTPRARQAGRYAVKLMRPDRLEYALPLFKEETRLLAMLRDVPGISPLVECGYLKIENISEFPTDHSTLPATALCGPAVRYGAEEALNFLAAMERYTSSGWLPYLTLVERNNEYNLMRFCDSAYNHGWFLPLKESLLCTIQICTILQNAHDRNIVYRDHKILHYYWDPEVHGVEMIDWNIARHHANGLTDAEKQADLVQFGARAMHHILTGRPAAGSLPLGPNRAEEIEQAAQRYNTNWTYDDERLPKRLKEIVEQTLNQGYTQVRDLRQDLADIYERI